MNTNYLVIGVARYTGAIGLPDEFEIEESATSSLNAYASVRDALYNDGYETVLVKAIKMRSPYSQKFTIIVPPDLYLGGTDA